MFPNDDQMAETDVVNAMLRLAERASERNDEPPDDATERDSGWWYRGEDGELRSTRKRRIA